jgi:hypothetical protein
MPKSFCFAHPRCSDLSCINRENSNAATFGLPKDQFSNRIFRDHCWEMPYYFHKEYRTPKDGKDSVLARHQANKERNRLLPQKPLSLTWALLKSNSNHDSSTLCHDFVFETVHYAKGNLNEVPSSVFVSSSDQ